MLRLVLLTANTLRDMLLSSSRALRLPAAAMIDGRIAPIARPLYAVNGFGFDASGMTGLRGSEWVDRPYSVINVGLGEDNDILKQFHGEKRRPKR